MRQSDIDILLAGAATYGVTLDDRALARFLHFEQLLVEWSHRTNLVSKNDLGRLVTHHFLDSLKLVSCVEIGNESRLLDFGSGAGFPGVPLAIAFDRATVYLVESRKKRCEFLSTAIDTLELKQVSVLCSRIESIGDALEESFTQVVTRATISLPSFYTHAARFLVHGGSLAAIKGNDIDKEFMGLTDIVDTKVFNILRTQPAIVPEVRTGWIVGITRKKLSTPRGI